MERIKTLVVNHSEKGKRPGVMTPHGVFLVETDLENGTEVTVEYDPQDQYARIVEPIQQTPGVQTTDHLKSVIHRISFAPACIDFGWNFEVEELNVPENHRAGAKLVLKGWFVNTTFRRPDTHTGQIGIGRGRKEFIAAGTSEDGVIKTCWLLCELMEAFLVDKKRIFDPHSSIELLQYGKVECPSARAIV
jgi:hypothetical protein